MPSECYWISASCSKCNKVNWLCDGDGQDDTREDIEAIECWSCGHKWWRDPEMAKDMYGHYDKDEDDITMEECLESYAEKGKEKP